MLKSESIENLAQALALFQGEVRNPSNSAVNPFYKSSYAPLSEVLNTVRPILSKHGLSVLQTPSGDGEDISVTTLLLHSSGEWIQSEPLILKADKPTAQGAGSSITYARRYALSAVLGISSEDDDDGNVASAKKETPKKEMPKKETPKKEPTKKESNEPTADINFAPFWTSVNNLGLSKDKVYQEASAFFEVEGLTSLKDIPNLTNAKLNRFLTVLISMRGND